MPTVSSAQNRTEQNNTKQVADHGYRCALCLHLFLSPHLYSMISAANALTNGLRAAKHIHSMCAAGH